MLVSVTSPSFSSHSLLLEELRKDFPNFRFNREKKELAGEALLSFLKGSEAAIIGRETIDASLIDALPQLLCIAKYGVGLDNIDLQYAKKRGIHIGFQPGSNRRSVAELALCFLLGLARNVFFSYAKMKEDRWLKQGGQELSKKSVGIIGCGNTGSELVKLLLPLQCLVLVNDIADKSKFIAERREIGQRIRWASKEEIYSSCDLISLHTPLSQETEAMIDAKVLKQMKASAYLVNTSRGKVIDEQALKQALRKNEIAGAALDVFIEEPLQDKELSALSNIVLTPHIGGNAKEAVLAMGRAAIQELKNWKENRKV